MSPLPEPLITQKDILPGSISFQGRSFGATPTGGARERRMRCTFTTANAPTVFQHGLGKQPTTFVPVPFGAGTVYSDYPIPCDRRSIVLKCTAAITCEVIVR